MKVLVVGAGPGGLSAALAMAQREIDVRVVELKSDRATVGSELCLLSANLRTLDTLGVADACVRAGSPLYSPLRFFNSDGELIAAFHPPKLTREDLPGAVGIQRRALHDVLYEACEQAGVGIEHGISLTNIEYDGPRAIAHFADGRVEAYDLIVGADGVNSTVRALAFPDAESPTFVGQFIWRVRVPYSGPSRLDMFAAPYSGAGLISVSDDAAYIFCLVNGNEDERIKPEDYVAEARKALGKFGGSIAECIESINDPALINYSALKPVLVNRTWFRSGVLLIGDAAHAVTPHLAHGAGLAIEDGLVLGEELRRHDNVELAAAAFMERRFGRCATAFETTVRLSKLQQTSPFPTEEASQLTEAGMRSFARPI